MTADVYRFEMGKTVPLNEAEQSLHLALIAVQGLFGQARVRMDAAYHVDESRRVIVVDGTTEVGAALVRVFTELLLREFGGTAFRVRRVQQAGAKRRKGKAA